jgi:hypothetical protein
MEAFEKPESGLWQVAQLMEPETVLASKKKIFLPREMPSKLIGLCGGEGIDFMKCRFSGSLHAETRKKQTQIRLISSNQFEESFFVVIGNFIGS